MIASFILFSATVCFAQFAGGSGTEDDPYLIETAVHLDSVRNHLDYHFLQIADIDLNVPPWNTGEGWEPIGVWIEDNHPDNRQFSGSYNGNSFVINGLYINRASNIQALFSSLSQAVVENVSMENVDISGESVISSLVANAVNNTIIKNCYGTGNVNGNDIVGGLVGRNAGGSIIKNSYSNCTVEGITRIGGLTGINQTNSIIINSFNLGNVVGENNIGGLLGVNYGSDIYNSFNNGNIVGNNRVGGLVGRNVLAVYPRNPHIENSYNTGEVNGFSEVGGLVGTNYHGIITNCFNYGIVTGNFYYGGLVGWQTEGITTHSYWDIEASGLFTSASGEGRTTEEMTYPYHENTYVDWDFEEVWYPDIAYEINNGYPYLQWQTGGIDLSIFVYTNIEVVDAEIILYYSESCYVNILTNLNIGWNEFEFDNVPNYGAIEQWYASARAIGYGGEIYHILTYNNFEYNSETRRWENNDIEFAFENKRFHNDYNWVSFPRLNREGNEPVEAISEVLTAIYPTYTGLLMEYFDDSYVIYDGINWDPEEYPLRSSDGVIIHIAPEVDSFRVYVVDEEATRLSGGTTITLNEGINYIGYWVPNSQRKDDAFGEHWDKVEWMKYETWYFDRQEYPDGRNQSQPVPSTRRHPLHYGEGYIVYVNEEIPNFGWNVDSGEMAETYHKEEPRYFTVEKDFHYQAIDVLDIPSDVIEIGVFQNRACVGAVVVQEPAEQILVYSDPGIPLTFELITERGSRTTVTHYGILDPVSGRYRYGQLTGGINQHSIISFVQGERFAEDEISTASVVLHKNYPNPANPETTFSFTLAHKQDVELTVYNIRGQKVRTLYEGSADEGAHSIVWDGKDTRGRVVSSGVYFYKLKTHDIELTEKMILLK